jgi:sugar phosphate isomerase/epimerase
MPQTADIALLAAHFTLGGDIHPFGPTDISPFPFRDRVEAAARAGFTGFGLIHGDAMATAAKIGLPEMRRIVEANGIQFLEMEFLLNWYHDGEPRRASDIARGDMMKMASALGIRDIKIAPGFASDLSHPTDAEMTPDIPLMTQAFIGICREAAEHGTSIVLEIMPFSNVRTIETARAIVEAADQPNGGLLVDIWHLARGGIPYADIALIPPRFLGAIELNDADAQVVGELWQDTIFRRKLPGEGALNPPSFIKAVQAAGYQGPWGVEILSETLRKLPLDQIAKRAFDTTMAQFAALD